MKLFKHILPLLLLAAANLSSAQILYKVEGNGIDKPSYIFGTHHLAPTSVIEKFGVLQPYKDAVQVVGEIDMTQDPMQMTAIMQPHMMAPADSTLSRVLPAEEFNALNDSFKELAPMPGMDLSMLEPLKPMAVNTMVSVVISQKAMPDFNPNDQLDSWFQTNGVKEGKKIVPLETVEQQAAVLFDCLPISMQAEALVELLKEPGKAIKSSQDLTDAYMAQDLGKMLALSEAEDTNPQFMLAILDNRNAEWLKKLPSIFKDGPAFVAVGALHLAGKQGIVEGLRNLGYSVTPVK